MKTLKALDQAITTLIETGGNNAKLTLAREQVRGCIMKLVLVHLSLDGEYPLIDEYCSRIIGEENENHQ